MQNTTQQQQSQRKHLTITATETETHVTVAQAKHLPRRLTTFRKTLRTEARSTCKRRQ